MITSTSLFLIGLRGSGKTSAGRIAASDLNLLFVDADEQITNRAGCSIARLFAEKGEPAFRALERELMLELLQKPAELLVATGGGCILDPEVRRGLARTKTTLWLDAPVSILGDRIRGSDRPSLTGADPTDELVVLREQRRPLYKECAAALIDTGALTINEVARAIQHFWTDLSHHDLR